MADSFKPPKGVQSAARRGLELRAEQSPSNRGGTSGRTCPAIDEIKRIVKRNTPPGDPDRARALELLEQLRADNLRLREGHARAMKLAKKLE